MPTHRKPPNRRAPIYTAVVLAVAVFIVILGFEGSPKRSTTAQTSSPPSRPASPAPATSASPVPSVPSATPARPSVTPKPTPSTRPKPSTSSSGLGTSDASLNALTERVRTTPVRVAIPALNVNARVIPVGVDRTGALRVPKNVVQAAWYQSGSAPGQPGTAIIAAHVDFGGKLGLFNRIHTLHRGSVVYVTDASNHTRAFHVVAGKLAPKSDPSTVQSLAAASAAPGRSRLALITCGGDLNTVKHSYYDNFVLLADQ